MLNKYYKLILIITLILLSFLLINGVNATDNTNSLKEVSTISDTNISIYQTQTENTKTNISENKNSLTKSRNTLENNDSTLTTEQNLTLSNSNNNPVDTSRYMKNTNYNSENTKLVSNPNDIYISPEGLESSEGTIDNPTNWETAINNINNNGIIHFKTGNYTNIKNQTINKNLTLSNYNGEVIIDNEKMGYTFYCDNSENSLTIIGLTFINGTGYFDSWRNKGGSICSEGNLTIINSTFKFNTATNGWGGAVYTAKSINIINSTFTNNNADNGGGIYSNEICSINNSTFSNNVNYQGGSLYSYGDAIITDSTFQNCLAGSGGAIFEYSNIQITNSIFINNTAFTDGGALYVINNAYIKFSTFINNNAQGYGGVLVSPNCNVNCSVFLNNSASNGSAICYYGNILPILNYNWWGNNSPFSTNNNLIYRFVSSDYGYTINPGNFVILTASNNLNIINVSLNRLNNDEFLPDGMYIPNRTVIYSSNEVSPNPGDTFTISTYNGINPQEINVTVDNQSLTLNLPGNNPLDIYYVNGSYTGTSNGTLENPFKTVKDAINYSNLFNLNATIYIMEGTYYDVNMTVANNLTISAYEGANVILDGNKNGYIFDASKKLTIIGLTLQNGTGKGSNSNSIGGVIISNDDITIINSKFINNTAKTGGAIYASTNVNIINSTFINNTAIADGGAILCIENCNIVNSSYDNNKALTGGAIYTFNNQISYSIFKNNSATNAGVIYSTGSCKINNSIFESNNATNFGGVIYSTESCNMTQSVLTNNKADIGNVIYFNKLYNKSNFYVDYNWWGNNTPFNSTEYLILNYYHFSYTPKNWVILTANNNGSLLSVSLDYYRNSTNIIGTLPEDIILPYRNVTYSTDEVNPNPGTTLYPSYYTGNVNKSIDVTVDNQTLTLSNVIANNITPIYVNGSYTGSYNDGTINKPFKTVKDAINFTNRFNANFTIYIMEGTYYDVNMTVANNLTISAYEGANVILDGNKNGYIFYTNNSNNTFTIIGLTLMNCTGCYYADESRGGAILSYTNLTIINSTFKYNSAYLGGSIFNYAQSNIINSTFNSNNATIKSSNAGGAIISYGDLTIINSLFFNNSAYLVGAVGSLGYCNISNSTFINNRALNVFGGAIYSTAITNINSSIFINNSAKSYGGCVISYGVNVSGSVFLDNHATHGNVICYVDSPILILDYNWWGNNTPFVEGNNLIFYYYSTSNTSSYTPTNWIIMTFNINPSTISPNGYSLATVSLNTLNNTSGITTNLPSNIVLPNRTVTFSTVSGSFNYNSISFSNTVNSIYTANNNSGTVVLSASIDNQTINQNIIIQSIIPIIKVTSITNTQLNSVENGTVNINVIDEDSIVNVGSVNLFYNNTAISTGQVKNGIAILNLTGIKPGNYSVIAFYFGKDPFDSCSKELNLTITKTFNNSTILTCLDLTKYFNETKNLTGKLLDSEGNPIMGQHVALNLTRLSSGQSKVYWVTTDTNGDYYLEINLSPGNYTAKANFNGNSMYESSNSNISSIIVKPVNKIVTNLTADKFNHTFGAGLNFTGKLVNNLGNPIMGQHVALNLTRLSSGQSKVYWVTTDTDGAFQLQINLGVGEYTAHCSYDGTSKYQSSSVDATISVINM